MSWAEFDPVRAIRVLTEHGVRFIVIGGYAGALLGAPLVTNDLDVCYARDRANLRRLAVALQALNARRRVARVTEEPPFLVDAETLAHGDSFTFATDAGNVDILATPYGTAGYRDLVTKARTLTLSSDVSAMVVDISDLMRMKEHSGRVKDELHLHVLAGLKVMLETEGECATSSA